MMEKDLMNRIQQIEENIKKIQAILERRKIRQGQFQDLLNKRGITRLVHFTRVKSLKMIIDDGKIESTRILRKTRRRISINDRMRLDSHLDYICCSVQYPNVYLLDNYRKRNTANKWVILFLNTDLIISNSTRFSRVNAAKYRGQLVQDGIEGFESMFRRQVHGMYRLSTHLFNCPTDIQSEVLVKGPVPISKIIGLAVESENVRKSVAYLINLWPLNTQRPRLEVVPELFDKYELPRMIQR